jgi:hypothetical protein
MRAPLWLAAAAIAWILAWAGWSLAVKSLARAV